MDKVIKGDTENKEINILIQGDHTPLEVADIILEKVLELNAEAGGPYSYMPGATQSDFVEEGLYNDTAPMASMSFWGYKINFIENRCFEEQ